MMLKNKIIDVGADDESCSGDGDGYCDDVHLHGRCDAMIFM